LETLVVREKFWQGKNVLITGHTGFKGSWLSLWLQQIGANIVGVSLDPLTTPNLYEQANVAVGMQSFRGDVRNYANVEQLFKKHRPELVFHLAAQPLVRYSYNNPIETYSTNVMGTLHVLEAIRKTESVRAAVMVTTDKCYENKEWIWGYRENDAIGGHDPYSSSKGAAELVISSYRNSYFSSSQHNQERTAIASARSGNVIGGGDWSEDRIVPDSIRAFQKENAVQIRNPNAVRPWQHVLEPLSGYIRLAELLFNKGQEYAQAWNFGPPEGDVHSVRWIVEQLAEQWGNTAGWVVDEGDYPHEANYLKLDCSKANLRLNWHPQWDLKYALLKTVEWHKAENMDKEYRELCLRQINEFMYGIKRE
jgi:CDP-glucose 4,6-dehydratase